MICVEIILAIVAVMVGVLILISIPDIARYIRISRM
jgi:hypothetical protein